MKDNIIISSCDNNMLANQLFEFRGVSKINNEVIYGNYFFDGNKHFIDKCFQQRKEVYPKSVSLFTGFFDFNKNKIYEGDIFMYNYTLDGTQTRIKKVEFNKEVGAWYLGGDLLSTVLIEQNNDDWKKSQNYKIRDNQYLRISGNIFQNPELF